MEWCVPGVVYPVEVLIRHFIVRDGFAKWTNALISRAAAIVCSLISRRFGSVTFPNSMCLCKSAA